jgi:hypothetical protein
MAHFAELDPDNVVTRVIVVSNDDILDESGNESEQKGIEFLHNLFGQDTKWVQTSFNGNFRYKFAGIGDTYDEQHDVFVSPGYSYNEEYDTFIPAGYFYNEQYERFLPPIPEQPHPLWWYDPDRLRWRPPFPKPWDTYEYEWDESISNWKQVEGSEGTRPWTLDNDPPVFERKY